MSKNQLLIHFYDLPDHIINKHITNMFEFIPLKTEDILVRDEFIFKFCDRFKSYVKSILPYNDEWFGNPSLCEYIIDNRPELMLHWESIDIKKKSNLQNDQNYYRHINCVYINDLFYTHIRNKFKQSIVNYFSNNLENFFSFNHSLINKIDSIRAYPVINEHKLFLTNKKTFHPKSCEYVDNYELRNSKFKMNISCNLAIVLEISDHNMKHLKLDQRFVDDYLNNCDESYTNNVQQFEEYMRQFDE